jgi:hypothetical protein
MGPSSSAPTERAAPGEVAQVIHCCDNLAPDRGIPSLADSSIDAIVTDPPAGISFMGKAWDGDRGGRGQWIGWLGGVMRECLRVLKPGGYALVWALPRTSHWTTTAIEDAGFEIRDVVTHLFGTGFPKSLNLGDGRGTALKPAAEFWILARKPLDGTYAENVATHGTGVLNIDGCRIGTGEELARRPAIVDPDSPAGFGKGVAMGGRGHADGRWPAHVVLSHDDDCTEGACVTGCAVHVLDEQSIAGGMHSAGAERDGSTAKVADAYSATSYQLPPNRNMRRLGDKGGASRFFYVAKGSRSEKTAGGAVENKHPTVKSIALMRWLCRLVTPPGGVVLDPFAGTGTTGLACHAEGFQFIGFEREPEYAAVADQRMRAAL